MGAPPAVTADDVELDRRVVAHGRAHRTSHLVGTCGFRAQCASHGCAPRSRARRRDDHHRGADHEQPPRRPPHRGARPAVSHRGRRRPRWSRAPASGPGREPPLTDAGRRIASTTSPSAAAVHAAAPAEGVIVVATPTVDAATRADHGDHEEDRGATRTRRSPRAAHDPAAPRRRAPARPTAERAPSPAARSRHASDGTRGPPPAARRRAPPARAGSTRRRTPACAAPGRRRGSRARRHPGGERPTADPSVVCGSSTASWAARAPAPAANAVPSAARNEPGWTRRSRATTWPRSPPATATTWRRRIRSPSTRRRRRPRPERDQRRDRAPRPARTRSRARRPARTGSPAWRCRAPA